MSDWARKMDWGACRRWAGGRHLYTETFRCRAIRVRFWGYW